MKIWYQSSTPLEGKTIFHKYRESIFSHAKKILPDVQVEIHGVAKSIPDVEYRYVEYLNKKEIIDKLIQADVEGYDAVALGCFLDPGLEEARGVVSIPIVTMGESSMLFSCMLGSKFSIITYNERLIHIYERNIKLYGLENRAGKIGVMNSNLTELAESLNDPKSIIEDFINTSKELIKSGTEVIIPGCGLLNLLLVENHISMIKKYNVPVVDCVGLNLLITYSMAKLKNISGVSTSRKLLYTTPPKDIMEKIKRFYK
jgi:allantoin racemase